MSARTRRVNALRDAARAKSQEDAETRARDELMEVVASIPCLHKNDNPHTTSTELLACVIEAIRAEQRERDASILLKRQRDGGVYPHACSSCGLTDEEWTIVKAEQAALKAGAAAVRAQGVSHE